MPDLTALSPTEHAMLAEALRVARIDHPPRLPFAWRWLFALKCWCDRRLYGAVQLPSKCCPACGLDTTGQRVQPPYHAACAPPR